MADLYQVLIQHLEDVAIFLLDADGNVATWNPGAVRMFGYAGADILGAHVSKLYAPEDLHTQIPQQELRTAQEQGHASDDRWLIRKDGRRIWVREVTVCLKGGASCTFGKVVRDETESKRRDEEIQRLNNELQATVKRLEHSQGTLNEQMTELERFEEAVVGRELNMLALKKENEKLKADLQKLKGETT